jgi:hypothetical protein
MSAPGPVDRWAFDALMADRPRSVLRYSGGLVGLGASTRMRLRAQRVEERRSVTSGVYLRWAVMAMAARYGMSQLRVGMTPTDPRPGDARMAELTYHDRAATRRYRALQVLTQRLAEGR